MTQKLTIFLTKIYEEEKTNFWLWLPVLFGFGAAFYFSFEENFLEKFGVFLGFFFAAIIFFFLNRHSIKAFVFAAVAIFLFGSFYAHLYQKFFLGQTKITGKIYVDVIGKVSEIKKFTNPINHINGANLVILDMKIYPSKFIEKKKIKKAKVEKKKIKKPRTKRKVTTPEEKELKKIEKELKKQKKREEKILKTFLNVKDYQEIDRKFLDISKNYQQLNWQKDKNGQLFLPNPPQKISVNLVKNPNDVSINDVIAARLMLEPPHSKEFLGDFNFILDSKAKKISAYGFVLGEAKILKKSEISNLNQWFLSIREKIRSKISTILKNDSAAIALAFLIGDQSQISKGMMNNIRNSGLAHLLSISGFHLALAGAIFFVVTRFLLSRSQYLALHFDLKKIASLFSILATFFYLKIADSPLPAQRAFLMIMLVLIALFLSEKINSKRAVMCGVLILILSNPFCVFNLSFQLSFAAILVLTSFYEMRTSNQNHNFLKKSFRYFYEIILLSILIQIATLPFLMKSFQSVALLGFIANILAIPLSSFIIMPLGFLALFLMPLNLEKYFLLMMEQGIFLIEKIAIFTSNLKFSNFASPQMPDFGMVIAIFALLLTCLSSGKLKLVGIAIFLFSFLTFSFVKKPDILFDADQKFFAIYNEEDGLVFSEKLRQSKKRELWMKRMGVTQFKSFENFSAIEKKEKEIFCDEKKCVIQKILIILNRNKISEICKIKAEAIVNLTSKYELPQCFEKAKLKIDNLDFYQKGGHFLYFSKDKISLKTSS